MTDERLNNNARPRTRNVLAAVASLITAAALLSSCALPASQSATPLRGQDAAAAERDRKACADAAYANPSATTAGTPDGGRATYWLVGGPMSAVGRETQAHVDAAFAKCMEDRGYRVDR
jgi:hypothetical protein